MKLSVSQRAALKHFKGREAIFDTMHLEIPFVDRICRCWPNIRVTMVYNKSAAPKDDYEKWLWLWNSAVFDPIELGQVTGLQQDCLLGLDAAIGNKLIYPDGSINNQIELSLKSLYLLEEDKIDV